MRPLGLMAMAAGCSHGLSVKGEIDGHEIALASGYFVQQDDLAANGNGAFLVVLSSLDDACALDVQFGSDTEEADDAAVFAEAWQAAMPDDFWLVRLTLQVGDPEDALDDVAFDGVPWNDVTNEPGEVTGTVFHYTAPLDEAYWEAEELEGPAVELEDYVETWYTDGGELEVTKHVVNESLRGVFRTDAATIDDGDTAGRIEIGFSVDRCTEMERILFE